MSYRYGSALCNTSHEAFVTAWSDHLAEPGAFTPDELTSLAEDGEQARQIVQSIRDDVGLPTVTDVTSGDHPDSPEIEADEEDHVYALQTAAERMTAEDE